MRIYALSPSKAEEQKLDAELIRKLKPHDAPVICSAIDRTGTLLGTGGADGVVKVWDIKRGFMTHTFHGHSGLVSALHFFEVDASNVQEHKSKKRKQGGREVEQELAEHTVGWRLASGGEDGKVRVWNLHKRTASATLDSHVSVVRTIDYSPEENALLSASRDKTVMVWDCKTWKNRMTLPVYEETETAGFLSKGTIIYTGGEEGSLKLWEMDTMRELSRPEPAKTEMDAIQESVNNPNLPFLLTVLADQTIVLHGTENLTTPERGTKLNSLPILRRICGNHGQIVDIAYVGAEKSCLALATNSEDVRIINLQDSEGSTFSDDYFGSEIAVLKGHTDIIISMDVDWSGHWLATGGKDDTARLWRVEPVTKSFLEYAVFTGHAESVSAVSLSHSPPPSDTPAFLDSLSHPPSFLISGAQDKTIKKWEIPKTAIGKDGKKAKPRALFTRKAHEKDINALAIHHNSNLFASASQDRTVKIWSVEDGSTIGILRGHRRGVWAVSFSPPGTQLNIVGASGTSSARGYVLTGSGDKTVRIWNLMDYSCLMTMEGHTNSVLKVLWIPPLREEQKLAHDKRGPLVASAGSDTLVKIWEANSGECATTLDNHTDRVWALAVRPPANATLSSTADTAMDMDAEVEGEDRTASTDTILISGAADGVLTFWRDTTSASADQARAQMTKTVETDQRLDNLVHSKNYREAIVLALQLDQPARLFSLFKSVADAADFSAEGGKGGFTGSVEVDEAIGSLADDQLYRLLLRCRDWSASARSALIAQRVLRAIVESVGMTRLAKLRPQQGSWAGPRSGETENAETGKPIRGTAATLPDILRGLRAYSERHYSRISDMWDESFMVEFTLREMEALLIDDDLVLSNGKDIIMVE
jgi:U3 small nucleolar RNA-associated protein 13